MPYDWATFLNDRIYNVRPEAPLDWIARGGYKLVYTDEATSAIKSAEKKNKNTDFSYSVGLTIGNDGTVKAVSWGGLAYAAGVTLGTKVLAVNGRDYDGDQLKSAITAAKDSKQPIHLLIKQSDQYRDVAVTWAGGLRYPHLVKVAKGDAGLDKLLAPKKS